MRPEMPRTRPDPSPAGWATQPTLSVALGSIFSGRAGTSPPFASPNRTLRRVTHQTGDGRIFHLSDWSLFRLSLTDS